MKRLGTSRLAAWLALLFVAGSAWGQQGNRTNRTDRTNAIPPLPLPSPSTTAIEITEADEAVRVPLQKPPPLEPPRPIPLEPPRYGGLIGDAMQMRQPLQLFNPLAPPEYGDGTRNLAVHPTSGRVEGVTIFSIKLFKSAPGASKAKKTRKRASKEG